ncbi:MAG: hypothetical protein PHC88_08990 [Terrimicrobiaceae bacterium]|nr:hypothetical protein [Terrimicrobiaceae bacterium]
MRPISKVLLLIVAAFLVYLLLPRTPNLKGFDPVELAKLEVSAWKAEKANKGTDALIARFRIYTSQFHFAPVTAFRMAQSEAAALEGLKREKDGNMNPGDENRALSAFTEKYALMKGQMKADFDADALAREEMGWQMALRDGGPVSEVAAPITHVLAALYGGLPEDFVDVATSLANSQAEILGENRSGVDSAQGAEEAAREGYKLLKEIATTPPAGA